MQIVRVAGASGAHCGSRAARWVGGLLVLGALGLGLGRIADAMEGPGGGESDPFAAQAAQASTNLFTGAAAVDVPILVPPGRALVTPELALRYSNHAGLSFVGMGWSIPIGVIARSLERGVPRCDGADPEAFRLTLRASTNVLVRESGDRFLLEYDEGFAEAIADRANNRWTVRTRDGLRYEFGGAEAARVHSGGDRFHDSASCTLTTAWHVTRLEDPNGNTVEIEWEKAGNTPLPAQITYGGNPDASIPHPFRIRFESESLIALGRPLRRTLSSGVDQRLERRIRRIVVEARETRTAEFAEIRRYDLDYDDSLDTADFLLAGVAATDLPERRFHYSTARPTIVDDVSEPVQNPETLGASLDFGAIIALMDLNGDALLDRLCVNGNGQWHAAYGESGQVQFTGYASCNGAGNWSVPTVSGVRLDRINKVVEGQDVYLTADLDGDGLPDLIHRPLQSASIHVYRGRCASAWDCGFQSGYEVWNNPYASSDFALRRTSTGNRGEQTLRDLVDLNGDGRPDLVRARPNGDWHVHFNTGSGFETTARVLPGMGSLLRYSPHDGENAEEERQLIDVNDDGLVDWVSGVRHGSPLEPSERIPERYFGVGPNGAMTGPFSLAGGPYLCAPTVPGAQVSLCGGSNRLPTGWAIVGAATVRLNTGSGFSAPIETPAPFWHDADQTANRLRASWTAEGSRETRIFRDFVDVNGDGRVDWVSTGYRYDGSDDWYVLYNLGDGRFGGGLSILEPAASTTGGATLGRVRPTATLADVDPYLGRSFSHTQPDDRTDRQMMVLDIDADGLPEHVRAFGIGHSDRWALKRLRFATGDGPHQRPLLLTRVDDGVGGASHFRYAPSSRFVPPPTAVPRLPFVTWLVTGIRRTDGLCDATATDWFSTSGNACLAAGHELVRRFEYADGAYDGRTREFLGFGRTRIFEGPADVGSLKEIAFHQTAALKGKPISESVHLGGVELLLRTQYAWRSEVDGPRTQVVLAEQRVEEWALHSPIGAQPAQCVVHRNSIRRADGELDPWTRVQTACSMDCAGAGEVDSACAPTPVGKKQVETVWAEPAAGAAHPIGDRPAEITTRFVAADGSVSTIARVRHFYDGLGLGSVERGRLVEEESVVDEVAGRAVVKRFVHDGGDPVGPGNVTSVFVPVAGASRAPTRIEFDAEFALHPVREIAAVSALGASAERRVERRFDFRHGKPNESVGLFGRGAGDVAGTHYDGLGRPVCVFEPGTSCAAASGFTASLEYRYGLGTPNAADPLARLSWVEVRRREPGAAEGYLATRTYFDALGRERLMLEDRHGVDSASANERPRRVSVVVRQLEYGVNGKPIRLYAPYAVGAGGPAIVPPSGTPFAATSYVLNGNAAGRLDPAGRAFESIGFDGSRVQTYHLGRTRLSVDGIGAGTGIGHRTLETLDAHGRTVERRSFEGAAAELARWNAEYDGRDQIVAEWFGGLATTRIERVYDLLGRAVETRDPDAGTWRILHDEAGNTVFRDDPEPGQGIQSCYDGLDRVVLQCVRASDVPDPNLCVSTQPDCTLAYRYFYDEGTPLAGSARFGLGRLTSVTGPDSRHRYAYDLRGRVTVEHDEIQGEPALTRYAHRPDIDRLERMTYPDGEIVRYDYDAAGQVTALYQVDANDAWIAYYVRDVVYDLRGRPVRIERGNLTTDRFEYHGADRNFALAGLSSRCAAAGSGDPRQILVDLAYRDYDARGRLVAVDDRRDSFGPLSMTAGYRYDGLGRLTEATGAFPEIFGYDAIGNLRSLRGQTFAQTSASAGHLGPHQFDRVGPASGVHWNLAYDANGRRTSKRRSDGSTQQTYAYDAFGAMRRMTVDGVETAMGYDHDGRRVFETRAGVVRRFFGRHAEDVAGRLVKFYYLGDRLVATRSDAEASTAATPSSGAAGALGAPAARIALVAVASLLLLVPIGASRRTLGLRVARSSALGASGLVLAISLPLVVPLIGCVGAAEIRHYHLNHLGSPVAISDAGGFVERQYRYSAYGEVRRFDGWGTPASGDATSRREFGLYAADESSGLQYAGYRFYDPGTASFLTPDPADEHASPYAFVAWDPINAVDPDGAELSLVAAILFALSAALVVASAIVAGVQTGSATTAFQTLGIGAAGLAAGFVVGLAAPAAAAASLISQTSAAAINASLSIASIGGSVYGLATADGTAGAVLAGAGLALAFAGAAHALGGFSRSRPASTLGGAPGQGEAAGTPADSAGAIVPAKGIPPRVVQRLVLEAQQRMVDYAQYTALEKVKNAVQAIRLRYLGQKGIDVYAEVLVEGQRFPHPTKLFAQHLVPNHIEVHPVVVPVGRTPAPSLLAPVPWYRFRLHDMLPVLQNGAPVAAH